MLIGSHGRLVLPWEKIPVFEWAADESPLLLQVAAGANTRRGKYTVFTNTNIKANVFQTDDSCFFNGSLMSLRAITDSTQELKLDSNQRVVTSQWYY